MQPLPTLTSATALAPSSVSELLKDTRRIVVVGAGGWVGRGLLRGLHSALGVDAFSERVFAFVSSSRMIELGDAITIAQRPLERRVRGRAWDGTRNESSHTPKLGCGAWNAFDAEHKQSFSGTSAPTGTTTVRCA